MNLRLPEGRTARALLAAIANQHRNSDLRMDHPEVSQLIDDLLLEIQTLAEYLNTPELNDFTVGVVAEARHQRARWSSEHDAGKEPQDWFWLLGYLAGKALKAHSSGDTEKALHHTISSAAALANWHAAILGASTQMRQGIDPVKRGVGE